MSDNTEARALGSCTASLLAPSLRFANRCPPIPLPAAPSGDFRLQILQHQHKMEEMQVEFAQMLRETLDKMHERLSNGTSHKA